MVRRPLRSVALSSTVRSWSSGLSSLLAWYAAGMTRVEQARTMRDELVCAAVIWKDDSLNFHPAARNEQPRTRRMLERIEPRREVWTIRSSPLIKAIRETMTSTASGGLGQLIRQKAERRDSLPNVL